MRRPPIKLPLRAPLDQEAAANERETEAITNLLRAVFRDDVKPHSQCATGVRKKPAPRKRPAR